MDHLPLLSARRAVRALAAFFVGLFAASFSILALADPSTPPNQMPLNTVLSQNGHYYLRLQYVYSDYAMSCVYPATPSGWGNYQVLGDDPSLGTICKSSIVFRRGFCAAGQEPSSTSYQCGACPAGEVHDAQTGTCAVAPCPSDQVKNTATNQCQMPCPSSGTAGGGAYVSPFTIQPSSICRTGCSYTVGSAYHIPGTGGGIYGVSGLVSTGQFCGSGQTPETTPVPSHNSSSDPEPATVTPPEDPPRCGTGKCPGYVNGTYVCVACSEMASENKPVTTYDRKNETTTTGTPPNQSTTTTTTDTRSTHNGTGTVTSTTSTTTTTTGPNGTTTSTESKETKEPKESFCKENPSSAFCKEGRFGGSCGSFTCEGDAVQCAVAREIHQRNCEAVASNVYTDMVDAAQAGSDTGSTYIQGQKDGTPLDVTGKFSSSLDASPIAAACPSPRSVPLPGGNSFEISFEKPCEAAGWLGNFVQAFAYLFAALIVLRNPSA